MAYSILLVFEKPDTNNLDNAEWWHTLSQRLRSLAKNNKDFELLGENVLMLPLDKGFDAFADIFPGRRKQYPYRYLILPQDIEWHVMSNEGHESL